jgi:hypothetical protein
MMLSLLASISEMRDETTLGRIGSIVVEVQAWPIADNLTPSARSVIDNEVRRSFEPLADVPLQFRVRRKDLFYLVVIAREVSMSAGDDVHQTLQLSDRR